MGETWGKPPEAWAQREEAMLWFRLHRQHQPSLGLKHAFSPLRGPVLYPELPAVASTWQVEGARCGPELSE